MKRVAIRRDIQAPWTARAVFAVEAALVIVVAYALAGLVSTTLDPLAGAGGVSSTAHARATHTATIAYRLEGRGFNPFRTGVMSAELTDAATDTDAPLSTLNLQVVGARLSSMERAGSAIIRTPDNQQRVYRIGDDVIDGVALYRIEDDRILLLRHGAIEALPFVTHELTVIGREPAPGAPASGDRVRADIESTRLATVITSGPLVTLSGEITPGTELAPMAWPAVRAPVPEPSVGGAALMAAVSPRPAPDGEDGVALYPRGDGAAFAAAGFQPGDVVKMVNGVVVADAVRFAAILSGLGRGSSVSVRVERGREIASLDFVLE